MCERKHVPVLIPGLIPGWGPRTLPGSVPDELCVNKAGSMPLKGVS